MIYHVTWHHKDIAGYTFVYDFYFPTKKEAVSFIKGLPFETENDSYGWSPEDDVTLTKINLPKTQKDWAWSLSHLVQTHFGTYQQSLWFGREVSSQKWTRKNDKWSVVEMSNDRD